MEKLCLKDYPCPLCGSKYPQLKRHGVYKRHLISFKNNQAITDQITITRHRCSSCNGTHAVLPESIIPYQSYSLLFILSVLKDYFTRKLSVESICIKYEISTSTKCMSSNFISIPSLSVGSHLSHFSDYFWNNESLARLMSPVDAATIAEALRLLSKKNYL